MKRNHPFVVRVPNMFGEGTVFFTANEWQAELVLLPFMIMLCTSFEKLDIIAAKIHSRRDILASLTEDNHCMKEVECLEKLQEQYDNIFLLIYKKMHRLHMGGHRRHLSFAA
jgi:hypothetical protein